MRLSRRQIVDLRVLLVVLALALMGLTGWSLRYFARYQPFADLSREYAQSGDIGLEASDAVVVGRAGGHRRWRASARRITFSRDRRSVDVEGLTHGLLLDSRERPLVSVSAGHAQYQTPFGLLALTAASQLRLDGGITARILRASGPIFTTQNLVWNSSSGQIACPGAVTANLPRLVVTAGNAAYSLSPASPLGSGDLRLGGGIEATIQSSRGMARVSTSGLTWDARQGMARTIGPVSAALPGSVGLVTADDLAVDTRTGDITGHHLHGTFRVSGVVQ